MARYQRSLIFPSQYANSNNVAWDSQVNVKGKKVLLNIKLPPSAVHLTQLQKVLEPTSEVLIWIDLDSTVFRGSFSLNFIKNLPNVTLLTLKYVPEPQNLLSIQEISNLKALELYFLGKRAVHLDFLKDCTNIEYLLLDKTLFDESTYTLPRSLKHLDLCSISLNHWSPLFKSKLEKLKISAVKSSAFNKIECPTLKKLQIWGIQSEFDGTFISSLNKLEWLMFDQIPKLKRVPSLKSLVNLEYLRLERLKNLGDLSALTEARALKALWIIDVKLTERDVQTLAEIRTLSQGGLASGNRKLNKLAQDFLGFETDLSNIWGNGGPW
jgi:hypothetical protein